MNQSPTTYALTILLLSRGSIDSQIDRLECLLETRALDHADARRLLRRLERVLVESKQLYRFLRLLTEPLEAAGCERGGTGSETAGHLSARLGFLARVDRVVQRGMEDETFDANQLAKSLAMSRAQLYRKFVAFDLPTPAQLILRSRLERASTLLRLGDLSVTSVAFEVGFKSVSHFSRAFRAHFGLAPSQWRARGEGEERESREASEISGFQEPRS
ncbi:MAG: helix-turn-helix transcriptional regulator [Holophagales bacterium]|nr:helix-turn-helix transcriptional regulator [Holophagales bacterium]